MFLAIALWGITASARGNFVLIVFLLCQLITAETPIITARKSDDDGRYERRRTERIRKEGRTRKESEKERKIKRKIEEKGQADIKKERKNERETEEGIMK